MTGFLVAVAICQLLIVGVLLVRLALGPSVADRIVALNTISTQSAVAVLYLAAFGDRVVDLDPALWLASFSYLGTFVWARFLERGLL